MYPSEGLMKALNEIRETSIESGTLYHKQVPVVEATTSITNFGMPILESQVVMNEFVSALMNRIAYTSFSNRYTFDNPLRILNGDEIPLGEVVQDIYVNPAQARKYNVNDFAGLLQKYEASVKVQYLAKNQDVQYCVSITRPSLKKAFTSWADLERFIDELSNSLYNGLYIDDFKLTKGLVKSAYANGVGQIRVVSNDPTASDSYGKAFIKKLRTDFLNMALPSINFNAYTKVTDQDYIQTWTRPEDIVLLVRNDVLASIDVDVLAVAFNMDKTEFLGRVIPVDKFDDAGKIYAFMGDRRWFRIHTQEMYLDEFYNANNRVWNYYLNKVAMFNYSLFANGLIYASEDASVSATAIEFEESTATVEEEATVTLRVITTPVQANSTITYTSSDSDKATVTASATDPKKCVVTGVADGSVTITATVDGHSDTCTVTVTDPA